MWPKSYKDYSTDDPLKKQHVESGNGIIGCEMHDLNGWGHRFHNKSRKRGAIASFILSVFQKDKKGSREGS